MRPTSKSTQPDNAEKAYKCSKCGNMATMEEGKCNICGQSLTKENMLYASNEDY